MSGSKFIVASLALTLFASAAAQSRNGGGAQSQTSRSTADQGQSGSSEVIDGFTEPYADINLAAAEMGVIADVLIEEGQQVSADQLVARLDDSVLQASNRISEAAAKAIGELSTAETQLELKNIELQKLRELFQREHASQQELDRVTGEVKVATARLQSVHEDLQIRKLEVARIKSQILQRQIRSTIDGTIVEVFKDRGEFVSPSDPVVARVVQLNPLKVAFSVPQGNRGKVKAGQQVNVMLGQTETRVTGVVEHVSPLTDASSGTFMMKVRVPNPDYKWHGGERALLRFGDVPRLQPVAQNTKSGTQSSALRQ